MIVLAIDLGTSAGWAVDSDGRLDSGTWNLAPAKSSCDRTRELTFFRRLEAVVEQRGKPDLLVFEDVVAHGRADEKRVRCPQCRHEHEIRVQATNTIAAQVYGGLKGVLLMWADFHGIPVGGVPVGTLKKFATGHGNATKDDMVAWAQMRWREQMVTTHDQADALHLLDYGLVEILRQRKKAKLPPPPPTTRAVG